MLMLVANELPSQIMLNPVIPFDCMIRFMFIFIFIFILSISIIAH